ncbi:RHS repeat-associated core domain-containing protein [Pseudomonas sp. BF-R-24]|uniref:RHS repeat-associated core domain-containing protein n=1 Tax=Pseudomonas sp. BF-R-24 TaxID=2832386 RepID=UPI001CBDB5BC|nr:RHS repeat-associated core domain-containing protein [Pseudomonas sp. BF-R-24]
MPMHLRKTVLLATDQKNSVLNALDAARSCSLAYTPYGHRPAENGLLSLLGFNGERPDPVTGHYHLGNGYRQFNPVLMRFNSPDSWSPFGDGGLNAYGYCEGEPISRVDQNGHAWGVFKALGRQLGLRSSAKLKLANSFNANSIWETPSVFYADKKALGSRVALGRPKQTASLIYQEKSNVLTLFRKVEYDNFSFITQTSINSKRRAISGEGLTSITPNKTLGTDDPDTFNYIKRIREHLNGSKSPLSERDLREIHHPIVARKIRQLNEFRLEIENSRGSGDPRRFYYKSGL